MRRAGKRTQAHRTLQPGPRNCPSVSFLYLSTEEWQVGRMDPEMSPCGCSSPASGQAVGQAAGSQWVGGRRHTRGFVSPEPRPRLLAELRPHTLSLGRAVFGSGRAEEELDCSRLS